MEEKTNKYIDLNGVYSTLQEIINDKSISVNKRTELKRFVQKLAESSPFLTIINQAFSNLERKEFDSKIKEALTGKITLTPEFQIRYDVKRKVWDLWFNNQIFLNQLDWNLVKKITTDLNVAFFIKSSRNENKKQ